MFAPTKTRPQSTDKLLMMNGWLEATVNLGMSYQKEASGQIIATSHDLTPNGRVVGEPCLKWLYFGEIQVGEIL